MKVEVSQNEINRAGQILKNESTTERQSVLETLTLWRLAHKLAIDELNNQINSIHQASAIKAIRVKRLCSIVGKLKRYPNMKLSKMQDLVGMRIILPDIEAVYKFDKSLGFDKLIRHRDYIAHPKTNGYRGIHRIYKVDQTHLELQIRTQQQHLWATAVEMTGTILRIGDDIKTSETTIEWLEFFALVSSALAWAEGTPMVTQHQNLSDKELVEAIAHLEKRLLVMDLLQSVKPVEKINQTFVQSDYQFLNMNQQQLSVNCSDWETAIPQYSQLEEHLSQNQQLVLVSVQFNQLRQAYPNYFMDVQPFVKQLQKLTSGEL